MMNLSKQWARPALRADEYHGVTGLTEAQKATLKALGAVEDHNNPMHDKASISFSFGTCRNL